MTALAESISIAPDKIDATTPLESNTSAVQKRNGRPPTYNPRLAEAILERLRYGESIPEACEHVPDAPSYQTVYSWLNVQDGFLEAVIRARSIGVVGMSDEILKISNDRSNDLIYMDDGRGGQRIQANNAAVKRDDLRISTRWKLMQAYNPRLFGDKTHIEHSGTIEIDLGSRMESARKLYLERIKAQAIDAVATEVIENNAEESK